MIAVDNVLWYGRVAHPEEVSGPTDAGSFLDAPCGTSLSARLKPNSPPRSTLSCPQRLNTLPPSSSFNPRQADKNTAALQELNDFLLKDERITFSLVPVGDGMALCTKR